MSTCDDDRKRTALEKRRQTAWIFKVKISEEVEANLGEIGDRRGLFDRPRDAFGRLFGDNRAYASRLLLHSSNRGLDRSRSTPTAHWRSSDRALALIRPRTGAHPTAQALSSNPFVLEAP